MDLNLGSKQELSFRNCTMSGSVYLECMSTICKLKKTSGTTKVNRQAHQLKKDNGTLTTDDTEKTTMLNNYFCTIAEKLIGPADEIQPLHAHSRENVDMLIMTSITISQKEIKEKICKLKVKKATGPDGVSARLLKYAGMSIAPSLTSVFKQSF